MKRTPLKRGKGFKKTTKADILREYGVPVKTTLRYKSNPLKGVYWFYLARYIRHRDAKKYGTCISCGKPKTFDELQAGHFAPAGNCGFDLLFDEGNINGECGYCNGIDGGHLIGYALGLDRRHGKGTSKALIKRYEDSHYKGITHKEWNTQEYKDAIAYIREKLAEYE